MIISNNVICNSIIKCTYNCLQIEFRSRGRSVDPPMLGRFACVTETSLINPAGGDNIIYKSIIHGTVYVHASFFFRNVEMGGLVLIGVLVYALTK